ncbi:MAG: transcriptional regulator [Pseudomonadota bacterium]
MMTSFRIYFESYSLDPVQRRLLHQDQPVDLSSRYLDALIVLAQHPGQLLTKQQFLDQIWGGVAVTDEVVTQCIKTLRQALGDDARNPRIIETVPKHGYRFIAKTHTTPPVPTAATRDQQHHQRGLLQRTTSAGVIGGGLAGVFGGTVYGLAAAAQAGDTGVGAVSVLLVVLCLTTLVAVVGGAGVGLGIAAARRWLRPTMGAYILGGASGGVLVGVVVKLIGVDAFNLLFGQSPGDVTGAMEGLLLGGAVGAAAWLVMRPAKTEQVEWSHWCWVGWLGAMAGLLIALVNGRLMVGSLDLLLRQFSGSRLRLDGVGRWFGEDGFGPISQVAVGALEGLIFALCMVAAIAWWHRQDRVMPRLG